MVAKYIERAGDKQKKQYNKGKRHVTFNVGNGQINNKKQQKMQCKTSSQMGGTFHDFRS